MLAAVPERHLAAPAPSSQAHPHEQQPIATDVEQFGNLPQQIVLARVAVRGTAG